MVKRKPNKARIKQWIKALRSGRYKQANLRLKDDGGGYCCLGVACNISKLGKWICCGYYVVGRKEYEGILPKPVADWLGIQRNPMLPVDGRPRREGSKRKFITAVYANDDVDWDFKQIADALEEKYL